MTEPQDWTVHSVIPDDLFDSDQEEIQQQGFAAEDFFTKTGTSTPINNSAAGKRRRDQDDDEEVPPLPPNPRKSFYWKAGIGAVLVLAVVVVVAVVVTASGGGGGDATDTSSSTANDNQNGNGDASSSPTATTPSNFPSTFPSSSPTSLCDDPANRLDNESIRIAVNLIVENRTEANALYGPIEDWCTQDVTNMDQLFRGHLDFNELIGGWDVSSVTSMLGMVSLIVGYLRSFGITFQSFMLALKSDINLTCFSQFDSASAFNQDISGWDVSSVRNMFQMVSFTVASFRSFGFNHSDLHLNRASTSQSCHTKFNLAAAFNQDISRWDVTSVTSMSQTVSFIVVGFRLCIYSSRYSVIRVCTRFRLTRLSQFNRASAFNQDISSWNVSSATDMSFMVSFIKAGFSISQDFALDPKVSLTSLSQFQYAFTFNQDISGWNVTSVTNMQWMVSFTNADVGSFGG